MVGCSSNSDTKAPSSNTLNVSSTTQEAPFEENKTVNSEEIKNYLSKVDENWDVVVNDILTKIVLDTFDGSKYLPELEKKVNEAKALTVPDVQEIQELHKELVSLMEKTYEAQSKFIQGRLTQNNALMREGQDLQNSVYTGIVSQVEKSKQLQEKYK